MSLDGFTSGAWWRSLATMVLFGAATTLAQSQAGAPVAHGLIIKLKESAETVRPREAALSIGATQRSRLHRVMEDAGMRDVARARLRPFGPAAQHVDFGRVLGHEEAAQLAKRLAQRPDVEWVVPNTRERRLATPNDPFYATTTQQVGQWWLYPVSGSNSNALADRLRGVPGAEIAWNTTTGGTGGVVAVLDTGIVRGHTDFCTTPGAGCAADRLLPGYDFVSDPGYANDNDGRDNDPADPGDWVSQADKNNDPGRFAQCDIEPSSWHGTDISGLMVAATNNNNGVAAVNWNGRVLPVRVAGKCGADPRDIVDGMLWAAGLTACKVYDANGNCTENAPINPNPARVINISFGGTGGCEPYQATIDLLATRGVVVVAAAGNERGAVTRPAKCPGAIGVGAVNRDGFKTNYSNFGPELTITTVGGDPKSDGVWGRLLGDDGVLGIDVIGTTSPQAAGFAYLFGTSFSAPIVGGTVSLMLNVNPALTAAQIIDGLRRSARPHVTSDFIGTCSAQNVGRCICTTSTCGAGLLDIEQAVLYAQAVVGGGTYTPPNRPAVNIDSADVRAAAALGLDEGGSSPSPSPPPSDDGGGGALEPAWLLALAIAALLIARVPRRRTR